MSIIIKKNGRTYIFDRAIISCVSLYIKDQNTLFNNDKNKEREAIMNHMNSMSSSTVSLNVYERVKGYFKENLPEYRVQEVLRYSDYPGDDYLYMVIAENMQYPEIKANFGGGPWACWTSWNDKTQSLNYGHYDLKSYDRAFEVCMEYKRK